MEQKTVLKKKNAPSHYQIYNYWKTKVITNKYEIVDYLDNPSIVGMNIIVDGGEPSCWCCKKPVPHIEESAGYLKSLYDDSEENRKFIWNHSEVKSHLMRCHIIPRQLGGSYNVDNFFLLCPKCHSETPDTIYPKIFFAWVYKLREECVLGKNVVRYKRTLEDYCDLFHINIEDVLKYIVEDDLTNLIDEYGSHKGEFLLCSEVGAIIGRYLKYMNNIKNLKTLKGEQLSLKL